MRIIAGQHRGRRLQTLPGDNTRPTLDSTREALFNILSVRVRGARVLDPFGGSGALSLEALSRGADSAVVMELSPQACGIIRANVLLCHAERQCRLLQGDALVLLKAETEPFDLIFLDPPYHKGLADAALKEIAENKLLAADGRIVVETGADEGVNVPQGFALYSSRKYGKTLLHFIETEKGEEA